MKWPSWMPRVLFESALIVFSLLLALALDQWRDERAAGQRAREAVAGITAELRANRAAAESSRSIHQRVHAMLKEIAARNELPTLDQATGGVFEPAFVVQTAWTAARDTGALAPLPFDVLLKLSRVYELQDKYEQLGSAIARDVYVDIRRRGVDEVLRRGFAGFIAITADFSGRETRLMRDYDDALAMLGALP